MLRLLSSVTFTLALVIAARDAGAIAACGNGEGWALASDSTVTSHPRLVYYFDARMYTAAHPPTVKATLDGKPVVTKVSFSAAVPYELVTIEVDTDKGGKLALAWQENPSGWSPRRNATYKIDPKLKLAKEAHGTSARFHRAYQHSTVHESEDGLAITVDVPAITFAARWRLDDKATWQTVDLTAITVDGHQVARLGELGCMGNFQAAILERGIDLELSATLVDGSTVVVVGLPAHIVLAPLPKDAPKSRP